MLRAHLLEALRILHILQLAQRLHFLELIEHVQERLRQHIRIIIRPVRHFRIIGDAIRAGDRAQRIGLAVRLQRTRQIQRIDHRVVQRLSADALQRRIQEREVERRIVCDQDMIADEVEDLIHTFLKCRRVFHILFRDARQLCRKAAELLGRTDKQLQALHAGTVLHDLTAKLDDMVIARGQSGRLQVEYTVCAFLQHRVIGIVNCALGNAWTTR